MMRTLALLMGLSLAVGSQDGCQAGGMQPAEGPDLAITSELEKNSPRMEGEVGEFEVHVRNLSKKYVILRDLVQPGLGSIVTWQLSRPGTLEYNSRSAEYSYQPGRASEQQAAAFNIGFLCPGEEICFRPRIRLLRLPRSFQLNYFSMEKVQLSDYVYFEAPVDRGIVYRRLFGDDLDFVLARKRETDPAAARNLPSHRTVVFPHAQTLLETPRQARVTLDTPLYPRPFALKDAAAKAGITPEQLGDGYTFYAALDRWVLSTPSGIVLVDAKEVHPLPATNDIEALYFHLDILGNTVASFAVRTPLEARLDQYHFKMLPAGAPPNRYILYAGEETLPRLLKALADEKLRIDVEIGGGAPQFVIRR